MIYKYLDFLAVLEAKNKQKDAIFFSKKTEQLLISAFRKGRFLLKDDDRYKSYPFDPFNVESFKENKSKNTINISGKISEEFIRGLKPDFSPDYVISMEGYISSLNIDYKEDFTTFYEKDYKSFLNFFDKKSVSLPKEIMDRMFIKIQLQKQNRLQGAYGGFHAVSNTIYIFDQLLPKYSVTFKQQKKGDDYSFNMVIDYSEILHVLAHEITHALDHVENLEIIYNEMDSEKKKELLSEISKTPPEKGISIPNMISFLVYAREKPNINIKTNMYSAYEPVKMSDIKKNTKTEEDRLKYYYNKETELNGFLTSFAQNARRVYKPGMSYGQFSDSIFNNMTKNRLGQHKWYPKDYFKYLTPENKKRVKDQLRSLYYRFKKNS